MARKASPGKHDHTGRLVNTVNTWPDRPILPLGFDASKLDRSVLPELIEHMRQAETAARQLRLRLEALQTGEDERTCPVCGGSVVGRSDRRYCSSTCRVKAHRQRRDDATREQWARFVKKAVDDGVPGFRIG